MPIILCIFKISDSGMSFRETVGVHPFCKQIPYDQFFGFLSIVHTCTHLEYPLLHLRTRFHRLIPVAVFTLLIYHSFLTLLYVRAHVKWPVRFFGSDTHHFQSGISYNPQLPTEKRIFVNGDFFNNRWRNLTTQKRKGIIYTKYYDEF